MTRPASTARRSQWRHEIRDFDHDVRATVRTTQGLLRLAGRDDLAERFRPILRRAVRRLKKAEEDEGSDQTAGADDGTPPEIGAAEPEPSEAETVETTD